MTTDTRPGLAEAASDGFTLADLDRATLAMLGREWLLHGHLQDRVGMALLLETTDREQMQAIAIDEWMVASPVYSRRMQRALNFAGDGVDTILKNLQLDIGAPHQFMDFRYRLADAAHGEFWLAHCGALMDVEPLGEDYVHGMCHAIEDPTFDATAGATNPLAQVRPIHRPPRAPADRAPHCHWRIDVVAGETPVEPHPNQLRMEQSLVAQLPVPSAGSVREPGGLADYSGEFDPDFGLEDLAHDALVVALQEFALQSHMLLRSYLLAVGEGFGGELAAALLPRLLAGWAGLTSERLRRAFDLPATAAGLAPLLRVHPLFAPASYIAMAVEIESDDTVRVAFADCPAAEEDDGLTWFTGLGGPVDSAVEQVLQGFDPRVRCTPTSPHAGELHAYRLVLDPTAAPHDPAPELAVARISTGARFRFSARPLRD